MPRNRHAKVTKSQVFFVDAAHFVLGSFLGMIWSLKRIFIRSGAGRKRYNVLGALDSHSKEVITVRTTDNINSESVCQLIDRIREIHADTPLTLVMDNASNQRNHKVKEHALEADVELLFLPAYSPNLNLIERLWKHLKKRCLKNKYFDCFDTFKASIDHYLDHLNRDYQSELDSLLTLKFQTFR